MTKEQIKGLGLSHKRKWYNGIRKREPLKAWRPPPSQDNMMNEKKSDILLSAGFKSQLITVFKIRRTGGGWMEAASRKGDGAGV